MQVGRAQGRFVVYELVCLEWEMPRLEVQIDRSRIDLSMKAAVNASEFLARGATLEEQVVLSCQSCKLRAA